MKAHTSVCVGYFCERVLELGSKYTPTSDVGSQEMPARKSGDQFGRNDQNGTLDELSKGKHWKPQGDLRDPEDE
jgi:hypothetical protein